MPGAFYVPEGNLFVPTELTRGPWSPEAQHAGPPAALIAQAIESLPGELALARFTLDVLRPVPLKPLRVEARAIRSGRSTQYATATLSDDDGDIALASAWRIGGEPREELDLDATPPPGPEDGSPAPFLFEPGWSPSYFDAMEWRLARGALDRPGPAAVWMRLRCAVVEGEEPSPAARVLAAADSGNGISWALPLETSLFINTEISVHLARMPEGEWVCLDARTRLGPEGVGLAESVLWDERGMIGRGAQSLLVAARR